MSVSDWRQTILDRLIDRNKSESALDEVIQNSECLCYYFVTKLRDVRDLN